MSTQTENAKAIFLEAIEQFAPDQWSFYLDQKCGNNQELRHAVEELLHAHKEQDSLFDRTESIAPMEQSSEMVGTTIGSYKLLQRLGEGGMGTVYLAERQYPIKQRVALKIIRHGMESKQFVARFEAERQALALMDHPSIAKVLDAGCTEQGRPFFVMELVKGIPISLFCDENRLTTRQRLDLFVQVCRAIHHAHQKGIIHRDLKPSNVLVALYDDQPVPKVIDFGVAKATNQQLTDKTMFTEVGSILGTWEYMSPEQAVLNQLDVDTRSDVYSLGVLLYELLTGETPLERKRLQQVQILETLRMIREDEPPKPSTRVSSLGERATATAAYRGTDPQSLVAEIRGDLDWVVMKALAKERSRRYDSASRLAEDIEHYLNHELVEARPPSAVYRMRKFYQRNRAVALGAGAVFLALAVGIGLVMERNHELMATLDKLRDVALEYRRDLLDAALSFAYDGKPQQASEISQKLEKILPVIDPKYVPQSVTLTVEGASQFNDGHMHQARETLKRAIDLDGNNFIAQCLYTRSLLNTGDWPEFSYRASLLSLPKEADFHERLFYWHAQLLVNSQKAKEGLGNLVSENPSSSLARATYALALVDVGVDTENPRMVEAALEEALKAQEVGPVNSLVALALVKSHYYAMKQAGAERKRQLMNDIEPFLELLGSYEGYTSGRLELAYFYEQTGQKEKAVLHWEHCRFPDFQAAVFSRDENYELLDRLRSHWGDTGAARLVRILADIGMLPVDDLIQEYQRLVSDQGQSLALRIAALQVPLRLRRYDLAIEAATDLKLEFEGLSRIDNEVDHLRIPLELLSSDGERALTRQLVNSSETEKVVAYYWLGHLHLSRNDTEAAVKALDSCVNRTIEGYTYQYWADCLRTKLRDNPRWPSDHGSDK